MRPCKPRRIGGLPPISRFVPQGGGEARQETRIGLDMLEALRLVDAEGMCQEDAARSMDVSTATLCRMLGEARRQVATALCEGHTILLEGGTIMFDETSVMQRRGHGPHGPRCRMGAGCENRAETRGGNGNGEQSAGMGRNAGRGHGRGRCRRGQTGAAAPAEGDESREL